MVALSLACAVILSSLASALKEPQELAKEMDRSKQMLIAAGIMSPYGYFQIKDKEGALIPAKALPNGLLEPATERSPPSKDELWAVYRTRIESFLVNDQGEATSFRQAGIDEQKYVHDYRKTGYYLEPLKLLYKIYPNAAAPANRKDPAEGYVIPINGMGLWDAIYGFLAIRPDGNTVIGISWYDQKETPGLGANIAEPEWQEQFQGKHIFQESADGQTQFQTAPLGIKVVKGKVSYVYGNSSKAVSAVDGMAGATLTGNGVMNAYRDVLTAYRPFLIKIHQAFEEQAK